MCRIPTGYKEKATYCSRARKNWYWYSFNRNPIEFKELFIDNYGIKHPGFLQLI